MPCNATSQLTNAPSVPLQVTMPTNNAQWAVFVQRLQDVINSIRTASTRQPVNVVPADFAVYNGTALPALSVVGATAALDTTKHQFGAASLKLTATAATVTVEFSANPIILPPNSRWIESVYIQSSRTSIAGTLAIDTPSASHPVDISGTLLPGTWGRLYGDCDLTADFSTTATMALTFTGCAVGDTFNLEGWQIEAGTGSLPSPFVNTTVPQTYVDTVANAVQALANANAAQSSANTANAQLANIASDNILSPAEKPTVERDYSVITTEQAGIDAQALAYLQVGSSQQVAYDNAISALTAYLGTLTTPTAWNDKSGNTTIAGPTFRANFNAVYTARQALLDQIYSVAQALTAASGDNLLFNPGFESNAIGSPNGSNRSQGVAVSDGWYTYSTSGSNINTYWFSGAARTGAAGLLIRAASGTIIPANSGYAVFSRVVSAPIPVNGGDTLTIGGWVNSNTDGGLVVLTRLGLYAHHANGTTTEMVNSDTAGATGGWKAPSPAVNSIPSDVTSVQFQCAFFVANTTGSPITVPSNNVYAMFDDLWVTRNDLRVAGSGTQIGDVRQLPPTSTVGVRSVLSTSPISFSISGTTVNFTTTAFSAYNSGVTTAYNAASGSVTQAAGTTVTYYLYFIDPNYAGGSQTLHITTSIQAMAQAPGLVNIGNATVTVASGGGGSGGTGSGGGGYCVCDDMWIDAETQAKDAQPGHLFDCCDLPTRGLETFKRALQSVDYHDEECVRLTTDGGAQLDCGYTTPFDTVDGRVLRAPEMRGELVLTDEGLQRVASVEWIGVRRVCYFHFGGVSYAAGCKKRGQNLLPQHRNDKTLNRIYSHNFSGKP